MVVESESFAIQENSGFPGLAAMNTNASESPTTTSRGSRLFHTASGENLAVTFVLITSLFLL